MAEPFELKATVRDRVGKGAARALRREGLIPAVIYGDKQAPISIAIPIKETTKRVYQGGFLTHVATVEVGGERIRVIPRDVQFDKVKDTLVHVDFLRVSASSRLSVMVPVHFTNEEASPGLKAGGTLNIVSHEVELECAPDSIPEFITVDLKGTAIGDSIHISAVSLPEGVTPTVTDRDFTIVTIVAPAALTSEEAAEAAAAAEKAAG